MLPREIQFSKTKAPPVSENLRRQARECIAQYVERANRDLGADLPMPTCSFDLRGTTAGQAYDQRNHIRINAVLFQENAQNFLDDTLPHEVAHLVTRKLYGGKVAAHGAQWQRVMRAFGLEPLRCHQYDVSNARVAAVLHKFACRCKTFEITPRRLRSARAGRLGCRKCGATLTFSGEVKENGVWRQVEGSRPRIASAAMPAPSPVASAPMQPRTLRAPGSLTAPPGPRPSLVAPGRPPSAAMLGYAQDLATKTGLAMPSTALVSMSACSAFIDQARTRMPIRAQVASAVPRPSTGTAGAADTPTLKQLSYADAIAKRRKVALSEDIRASKSRLSLWIDANR